MDEKVRELLAKMREARMTDAALAQRDAEKRIVNDASARGVLRSGGRYSQTADSVGTMIADVSRGMLADYLAVAADIRADEDELQVFENELLGVIEQMRLGAQMRIHEILKPIGEPSAANIAKERAGLVAAEAQRNAKIAFGRERLRRSVNRVSSASSSVPGQEEHREFFVSHAGEDRDAFVNGLVEELLQRGKTVWYSEYEITLGDPLRAKIDDGLVRSRYGVVVLSHAFFNKPWTTAELDALAARAMAEGRKVILPVWHDIDVEDIRKRSLLLASVSGIPSSRGAAAVVEAILRAADAERR